MKPITIIADDKVGLLADISYILGKAKINIEAINVDVVGGKAIIGVVLSEDERGKNVLEASGYKVGEINSIVLKVKDQPGELNRITTTLSKEGINIQNVHMLSRDGKNTVISMVVDKPKRAALLLKEHIINKEETY
ncbi:ACT domain-containing protein [Candidatus Micrarchaeota archaeon]|nr:ACT domain-containing protein [Candidatus Micrarchaeota archaeon]